MSSQSHPCLNLVQLEIVAFHLPIRKNPGLEPNTQWIRCTVCEILAFKLYCHLETGVVTLKQLVHSHVPLPCECKCFSGRVWDSLTFTLWVQISCRSFANSLKQVANYWNACGMHLITPFVYACSWPTICPGADPENCFGRGTFDFCCRRRRSETPKALRRRYMGRGFTHFQAS